MLSNAREIFSTFNRHNKESQEYSFAKMIANFLAGITYKYDFKRLLGEPQKLTDALYNAIHTYMDFNGYSKLTKPHQEAIFYYIIKTIVSNTSPLHQCDCIAVFKENIEKINNFIKEPTKEDFFLLYQLGIEIGNREEFINPNRKTMFHKNEIDLKLCSTVYLPPEPNDAIIFNLIYFLNQFISASNLRALSKESRQKFIEELLHHIVNFSPRYEQPYNVIHHNEGSISRVITYFGEALSDILTRILQKQPNQVIPASKDDNSQDFPLTFKMN